MATPGPPEDERALFSSPSVAWSLFPWGRAAAPRRARCVSRRTQVPAPATTGRKGGPPGDGRAPKNLAPGRRRAWPTSIGVRKTARRIDLLTASTKPKGRKSARGEIPKALSDQRRAGDRDSSQEERGRIAAPFVAPDPPRSTPDPPCGARPRLIAIVLPTRKSATTSAERAEKRPRQSLISRGPWRWKRGLRLVSPAVRRGIPDRAPSSNGMPRGSARFRAWPRGTNVDGRVRPLPSLPNVARARAVRWSHGSPRPPAERFGRPRNGESMPRTVNVSVPCAVDISNRRVDGRGRSQCRERLRDDDRCSGLVQKRPADRRLICSSARLVTCAPIVSASRSMPRITIVWRVPFFAGERGLLPRPSGRRASRRARCFTTSSKRSSNPVSPRALTGEHGLAGNRGPRSPRGRRRKRGFR